MSKLMHFVQLDEVAGWVNRRYQDALIAVIEEKVNNPKDFEDANQETLLQYALSCNLFKVARYLMDHKGFDLKQIGGRLKRNAFFYCLATANNTRFRKDRIELFRYMMQKDPYDTLSYQGENTTIVLYRAIEKHHYEIAKFLIEYQLSQNAHEEREPLLVKYLKEQRLADKRECRDFFSYLLKKTSDATWKQLYERVNKRLSDIVEM